MHSTLAATVLCSKIPYLNDGLVVGANDMYEQPIRKKVYGNSSSKKKKNPQTSSLKVIAQKYSQSVPDIFFAQIGCEISMKK